METESTVPQKVDTCLPVQPHPKYQTTPVEDALAIDKTTHLKEIDTSRSIADEPEVEPEEEIESTGDDATMAGEKDKRVPNALSRIKEFEERNKELEESVEELEDDLSAEKKKTATLKKENAKLEKYKVLAQDIKELKKKNTTLERDVKKLEKISGYKDEFDILRKKYAALDKDFKKLDKSKHSESEYKELEKKCSTLEKEINKLTTECEDWKPKLIGAKTALHSIQEETNKLKVEVMTLTTRLAATETEKDELKTQNVELMVGNEKAKNDTARYKHENICKWKEEQFLKAKVAKLEKALEQHASDAADIAELKQGITERGETIKMNMDRIAGLEQILQSRDRAMAALQAGQNAMAGKEIRRTLEIHRLTEQIAVDQNHNKYLYDKLASEMQAYHANVYHLRMGYRATPVPYPNAGGGYPCPPRSDLPRRSYEADVDRSGRAYMNPEERERREAADERARRESEERARQAAAERYRGEMVAGLQSRGELGRAVVGSFQLGMTGEQIGRAGVETYYSQDPDVAGPFGYRGPRGDAGEQAGLGNQTGERFDDGGPLDFADDPMNGFMTSQ